MKSRLQWTFYMCSVTYELLCSLPYFYRDSGLAIGKKIKTILSIDTITKIAKEIKLLFLDVQIK